MKSPRIGRAALFLALSLPARAAADSSKDLLAAGRVDDAIQTLKPQISHSPTDAEANNLLCRAYFVLEEWDHGISACERAVNLAPQNSLYHLTPPPTNPKKPDRAKCKTAADQTKKVRGEFERAVELD